MAQHQILLLPEEAGKDGKQKLSLLMHQFNPRMLRLFHRDHLNTSYRRLLGKRWGRGFDLKCHFQVKMDIQLTEIIRAELLLRIMPPISENILTGKKFSKKQS